MRPGPGSNADQAALLHAQFGVAGERKDEHGLISLASEMLNEANDYLTLHVEMAVKRTESAPKVLAKNG
jgi:hypothetical protein